MKLLINILLLAITATFTLPVNQFLSKDSVSYVIDMEELNIDKSKKEKAKEIVAVYSIDSAITNAVINPSEQPNINKSQFLHQVETPPPDFI